MGHFDTSLVDPDVQHVLCIVDASRLEKSLFFCLQVVEVCQRQGRPVTVVANMGDNSKRHQLSIDAEGLSRANSAPVTKASARTGGARGDYLGSSVPAALGQRRWKQLTKSRFWRARLVPLTRIYMRRRITWRSAAGRERMNRCERNLGWVDSSSARSPVA